MTTTNVRSPSRVQSLLAGPILVIALLSLAALGTPTARADAIDDSFIGAVKSKGIHFPSPQAAIVAGHEVCDELDLGRQKSDVASEVMQNSNLDSYTAGFFVGVSVAAFCPRYRGGQ
jgi:hypothetical protein